METIPVRNTWRLTPNRRARTASARSVCESAQVQNQEAHNRETGPGEGSFQGKLAPLDPRMEQAVSRGGQIEAHDHNKGAIIVALMMDAGQVPVDDQVIQDGWIDPRRENEQVPGFRQGLDSAKCFAFRLHRDNR